jgi:hypothetical protein
MVRTTFLSHANTHRVQFWFLHYYLLHAVFVSCSNIPCTFHYMHCTMPKFSISPLCTNTLHAPLTKLLHDNIYPHCTCTNQTPLRSTNTTHTMHAIIMCVHTAHTLLCVCTPCNAKFNVHTCTPIFFHAAPNFSARSHTPIFFHAVPKFITRTSTPLFFHVVPNFSARTSMPTFFPVEPNFYISHAFYYGSCIFSVPTCTHSFLCASIPREFQCRNWGFSLNVSPFLP